MASLMFDAKFLTRCMICGLAVVIWSRISLPVLLDLELPADDEVQELEGSDNAVPEENDREDAWFLPLGFPRRIPGQLYVGSDPEWKLFRKVASDPKRIPALKRELLTSIHSTLTQNPVVIEEVGTPFKVTTALMGHEFPNRAPPQYIRSGLEFGDNYISWTARKIPTEEGDRLSNTFQTKLAANALLKATALFGICKAARIMRYFGFDSSELPEKSSDGISHPAHLVGQPDSGKATGITAASGNQANPNEPPKAQPSWRLSFPKDLVDPTPTIDADVILAMTAFTFDLSTKFSARQTPPRGAFPITGIITLRGPLATCEVHVKGQYDLTNKQWVNVGYSIRSVDPLSTRPLGGR
ncbi:hypothetical protein AJ80_08771 [Polytolypa hystricis UAMH7299]|uniref:Uncharacterized protein n=1 Tax=Polytolypa hystricis (strain UAMH7299) TaxID=1447883 RepID=A0A2B7X2B0_POLH7|nr:hypothetical protein AJ80_08771 [Polytolypa hystricis UAMH7299]